MAEKKKVWDLSAEELVDLCTQALVQATLVDARFIQDMGDSADRRAWAEFLRSVLIARLEFGPPPPYEIGTNVRAKKIEIQGTFTVGRLYFEKRLKMGGCWRFEPINPVIDSRGRRETYLAEDFEVIPSAKTPSGG